MGIRCRTKTSNAFFSYPQFISPPDNFFLSVESVSLLQKFVVLCTIPMPGNYSGVKTVALVIAMSKHNTEYTTNKNNKQTKLKLKYFLQDTFNLSVIVFQEYM